MSKKGRFMGEVKTYDMPEGGDLENIARLLLGGETFIDEEEEEIHYAPPYMMEEFRFGDDAVVVLFPCEKHPEEYLFYLVGENHDQI